MNSRISDFLEAMERNRRASVLIVIFLLASLIVCVAGCVCVFVVVGDIEADQTGALQVPVKSLILAG